LGSLINDQAQSDEEYLLEEKKENEHDAETQLKKIKKLEAKFDIVCGLVKDIYAKHDKLLDDLSQQASSET
jgi:hypothetical protein